MIEISLINYYDGIVKDYLYNIYVLKAEASVVYVGRSQNIYDRWFGPRGRLSRSGSWFDGSSSLARMISNNPSWNWKLQLWTAKEAARFCKYKIPPHLNYENVLDDIETQMIIKLKPLENISKRYFKGKQEIPDFMQDYYKKLDEENQAIYDSVFNKEAQ